MHRLRCLQARHQLLGDGNLALLVCLRGPIELWLVAHSHGVLSEVNIRPACVHHFLLAHPGHNEEFEPQALLGVASRKQRIQFGPFVDLGFFFDIPGPVILLDQSL